MFFRKRRLPRDRRPTLEAHERVVAWAWGADDEGSTGTDHRPVVVATNLGLFLPGVAGRLGWHEIHKAVWDGGSLTVTPATVRQERDDYLVTEDLPARTVLLSDPGDLPRIVRNRVTNSVSYTSHHGLPNGGVRVVGRRVPGVDGLTWMVRYDPGTDPDDQEIRSVTAQLVAAAAATREQPPQPG